MVELMDETRRRFRLADDAVGEFSIEIDPREADADSVALLRRLGFNRMSLGVQDFEPSVQEAVNRIQSEAQTLAVLETRAEPLGSVLDVRDLSGDLPAEGCFGVLVSMPTSTGLVREPGLLSALSDQAHALPWAEAEVRRVDVRGQKLSLRHGEIKNLDMPPMTMVFHVTDPAWLEQVKPGDRIRFQADKLNGNYTVVALERMQ
jgi:Cu/Ag efflux protein CusF